MKYAREVLAAMRPYPGRAFRVGCLVRMAVGRRSLSAAEAESARKGVKRVLDELIDVGLVERRGGNTKSATYSWCGFYQNHNIKSCHSGRYLGQ